MYITKIFLKNATQETIHKLIDWCEHCQAQDKTFTYDMEGDILAIFSPTKDQAYKRGMAVWKRFNLNFTVEYRRSTAEKAAWKQLKNYIHDMKTEHGSDWWRYE